MKSLVDFINESFDMNTKYKTFGDFCCAYLSGEDELNDVDELTKADCKEFIEDMDLGFLFQIENEEDPQELLDFIQKNKNTRLQNYKANKQKSTCEFDMNGKHYDFDVYVE